jgi:integrase
MIERHIRPRWGSRKVASILPEDVEALHREISKRAPTRANRVVSVISTAFTKIAIRRKWVTVNPAARVQRNPENERERFLSLAELTRLSTVLDAWPDQRTAIALRLLLMTGCRRGELLRATWAEFDLDAGIWTKPASHCKGKRSHTVPLSAEALAELKRLLPPVGAPPPAPSALLFPSTAGTPLGEIRSWPEIRAKADLPGLRLHDLRHSAASFMVGDGLSLPTIGAVLGHRRPATTARYAHLHDAPVRAAVGKLGRAISGARLRLVS